MLYVPRGAAKGAPTSPWNQKCKQRRAKLKSQQRVSLGDSWPPLTQQHLAPSGAPGRCLQHCLLIRTPQSCDKVFRIQNIYEEESICASPESVFLGHLLFWCFPAQNFSLKFLLICFCLHMEGLPVEVQSTVYHLAIVVERQCEAQLLRPGNMHCNDTVLLFPPPIHAFPPRLSGTLFRLSSFRLGLCPSFPPILFVSHRRWSPFKHPPITKVNLSMGLRVPRKLGGGGERRSES